MTKIWKKAEQKICSYLDLDGKVQTLRSKFEALSCQAADRKSELEDAELRSGKKRKSEVENWLQNVELKRNKVQSIEQEAQERNITSFLSLRHRIDELIGEVTELSEQGRFPGGLLLDVRETGGEPLLTTKLIGQTFQHNLEKIWTVLRDDKVLRIGIYGMGGVGKTTLVSHIHNGLIEKSETFGLIYWVTVSQDFSIGKLQNDIAKTLKLKFSNEDDERKRAAKLSEALKRRKSCVLILDDVWNHIPLDRIGIPDRVNGCKLILTTRSSDVCRRLDCHESIKVEPLSKEEAWDLFMEKLGQHTTLSSEVRDIAMSVAAKCAGLPLGIVTMAASMRGVNDIHEWRNALEELKELTMGQNDMEHEVFPILKFSYSRLNDLKLQYCFLYCAFYPEDRKISRNELIRCFIAEGLIDGGKSWQAKFDKGHTLLNKLEKACLLESCNIGMSVKMHDLIRDMALKIIKESRPRFMVKTGVGLWEVPDEMEWTEDLEKVSLMENWIQEIPQGFSPRCHSLSTLILSGNYRLEKIGNSFFQHMPALKVLDLSRTCIKQLPNSVSDLENLTALLVGGCLSLTYVPPLGKLTALQELDLSGTEIEEVPQGVDRLVNLKYLNMEETENLEKIPSGILGRLSHLQCLLLCGTEPKHVSLEVQAEEREGLSRELEECNFSTCDVNCFNRLVKSLQRCGRLSKYVLELWQPEFGKHEPEHEPEIRYTGHCIIYSIGGEVENGIWEICVYRLPSNCLNYVFTFVYGDFLRHVKVCQIRNCYGMQYILSLPGNNKEEEETEEADDDQQQVESRHVPFQSLEELRLSDLPDLLALFRSRRELGFGRIAPPRGTFSSLKKLHISRCPKIKTTGLLLQHLQNLEKMTVAFCDQMEEIGMTVDDDADNHNIRITLPKFKKLRLFGIPELKSICEGIMVCDSIEVIHVGKCPMLKRLPFSLPLVNGQSSAPAALKEIKIDKDIEWWESLEWADPNAKNVLLPFLCFFNEGEVNKYSCPWWRGKSICS